MRILILGSVSLPIPPVVQGGTEWIAFYQAQGLAKLGHEIILVGIKGTSKNFTEKNIKVIEVEGTGSLVAGGKTEVSFDPNTMEASRKLRIEIIRLAKVSQVIIDEKENYDLILNNIRGEAVFLPIAKLYNKPFVDVMHLNLFPELADIFKQFQAHIITISNIQQKGFENLDFLSTIYNCVDTNKYTFNPKPDNYLLMVATIGRHKNQKAAIDVAKKLELPLVLVGKIRDQDYFQDLKKDIDGTKIKLVGEVDFEEKLKLYQNAKAFLFPINWDEPFGLVLIEAMACGTPVVAFNKGAVAEVVMNSKTGFIVENENEMIDAIKKIDSIKRADCRRHAEENFSVEKMVEGYQKALSKI